MRLTRWLRWWWAKFPNGRDDMFAEPKLLYKAALVRAPLLKRFWFVFWGALASGGAWYGLGEAAARNLIEVDPTLLGVGQLAAAAVMTLFATRAVVLLWQWATRRDETVRIYDQGFVWTRGTGKRQTAIKGDWRKIDSLREAAGGVWLFKRPLLQWGAHELKTTKGEMLRFTGNHGNVRQFIHIVRPLVGELLGVRIGQALRDEQPFPFLKDLVLYPGGLQVGGRGIPWARLDIARKRNRVTISEAGKDGRFKPVKHYGAHTIPNLAGLMEIASATIKNYQPTRFGVQVHPAMEALLRQQQSGGKVDIRVAPVLYDGVVYRSQAVVAFARLLKERRLKWDYEPEAFGDPKRPFSPSFFLPELLSWVDVQRKAPDAKLTQFLQGLELTLRERGQRLFVRLGEGGLWISEEGVQELNDTKFWLKLYENAPKELLSRNAALLSNKPNQPTLKRGGMSLGTTEGMEFIEAKRDVPLAYIPQAPKVEAPKVVDIVYKGVVMNNELEKRFAAELDNRRIGWQYVPERMGPEEHLICFYLPEAEMWVEVTNDAAYQATGKKALPKVAQHLQKDRKEALYLYLTKGNNIELYMIEPKGPKKLSIKDFWAQLAKR
jgi:hypothetical protein